MAEEGAGLGSLGGVTTSLDDTLSTTVVRPPSLKELQASVSQVNSRLSSYSRVLELNVDVATGLTIAVIRDSQTNQVLQQFPAADSLQLAQMLAGWAGGKNALLDLIA